MARQVGMRAEEEAALLRQRALEAEAAAVLIADVRSPERPLVYVNAAFERITGFSSGEVLGRDCGALFGPETDANAVEEIRQVERGGQPRTVTLRGYRRNGRPLWLEEAIVPLLDEAGTVTHLVGVLTDVTERHLAESTLRESEDRFRSAFENAAIGMALVGPDGRFLRVNRSLCEMLGRSRQELLRLTFQEITHPDDLAVDVERAQQVLTGERRTYQMEKRYVRGDGEVVQALLSVSLVRDEAGEPMYFVSQVQDITERNRAEEALRDRDAILEAVASCAELLVAASDWKSALPDVLEHLGRAAAASRAYVVEVPNLSHGRRSGQHHEWVANGIVPTGDAELSRWIPEVERGWLAELERHGITQAHVRDLPDRMRELLERRSVRSLVLVAVTVGGKLWGFLGFDECTREREWQLAETEALRVAAGALGGAIEKQLDLTRLLESEERFRGAFDNAPIGVALTSLDGRFLRVNRALCEFLGYAEDELVATTFQEISHPGELGRNLDLLERLRSGEIASYELEKRYLHKKGHGIWASLHVSAVRGPDGKPRYLISQVLDVDERRRNEESLRQRDAVLAAVASSAERLLRAASWENEVSAVLRDIGEAAGVSRSYVFRLHHEAEGLAASLTAEWAAPGVELQLGRSALQNVPIGHFEPLLTSLATGQPVQRHLRQLSEPSRSNLAAQDVRSILLVPVRTSDTWWGFLGFDECTAEREWTAGETEALRAAASMLGAAIQRRSADDARAEAESRYRTLVETLPLVTYVDKLDDRMTPVYLSPQIEAILGYSVDEWLSSPSLLAEIVHADDREEVLESEWPEGDGPHRYEYRVRAKDGREVWILDEYVIVRDAEGRRRFAQGYMVDITERRRTEEALREATETLEAVISASPVAIVGLDLDGKVWLWNPAAEQIFGWTSDEVDGRRLPIIPPERKAEFADFLERTRRGEGWTAAELVRQRKDGSLIEISGSGAPVRDSSGKIVGLVTMVVDISERKSLEAQLLQSQRLEAVGRLAGGVAHDFNNLLTAICGYGEFLIHGLADGDPLRRDAEEIMRAADRAAALVSQLLTFSRRHVLRPQTVRLNEIVLETRSLLRRLIGEDIELVTDLDPLLPTIRADPAQVEQIVVNLAVNARDAMPQGGMLTISTTTSPDARTVRLLVSDTGTGMDEHVRLQAFEPFFTTKPPGKGSGLGLSTVYGIVTQSGGRIDVVSRPGEGSTFVIGLPAFVSEDEPEVDETRAIPAPTGSGTVLLVEDEEVVRDLAARVLESGGYTVLPAVGGAEALAIAERHDGPIDLLLTDVVMPAMGGGELAERLRSIRGDVPVLFMSGYAEEAVWEDANDGERAFIGKPFTPGGLRRKVRELLGQ